LITRTDTSINLLSVVVAWFEAWMSMLRIEMYDRFASAVTDGGSVLMGLACNSNSRSSGEARFSGKVYERAIEGVSKHSIAGYVTLRVEGGRTVRALWLTRRSLRLGGKAGNSSIRLNERSSTLK